MVETWNWPVPSKESVVEQPGNATDLWNFTLVAGSSTFSSAFPTTQTTQIKIETGVKP